MDIKVLEPTNGGWLTQKSYTDSRVFSKMLINPQDDAWVEWTDDQKTAWEDAHKDDDWSEPTEEEQNEALLRFANEKTGSDYADLGEAVVDLVTK